MAKFIRNLALIAAFSGCSRDIPAPIVEGKCVATRYQGARATNQVCVFHGFNYVCSYSTGQDTCTLSGEATGEMPK